MFADRLIEQIRRLGTPLCVGVDPFADRIPALFGDARSDVSAVEAFALALVEEAAARAPALKVQLGLFEPYGPEGVAAARAVCAAAQAAGLIVILDAKRGDIGTTADGYAAASLGPAPGFDADAVTVNPYMGRDTLEPFLAEAERRAKGVAVLVRTSNPGARDVQDLVSDGEPVWAHVARMLAPACDRLMGASGWSGLMAVAGATYPDEARRLRALMPRAIFLVPGYGAQGASAQDAVAGFAVGPNGREGGLVNASRSVAYPTGAREAGTLAEWRRLIADAMDAAARELGDAARAHG